MISDPHLPELPAGLSGKPLWVIMPVYNERDCIEAVVREWHAVLAREVGDFVLCILNDCSKDDTGDRVRALSAELPGVLALDNPQNLGHGQTCIRGYRIALLMRAEWIFQIDSDGQCDPAFFPRFWHERDQSPLTYGTRSRQDGFARSVISRCVTLACFLVTGVWVQDANVPYRLMRRDAVAAVLDEIPSDFYLANIAVSVLQKKRQPVRWLPIVFRPRTVGGMQPVNLPWFARAGWKLMRQLRDMRA